MFGFLASSRYMGWFGKLPSVGDFAGRGLPPPLRETVHKWISSGMAALARSRPGDWRDVYQVSPVWHFAINAGIWDKPALIGCLAPSVDKVGRYSPLLALRSVDRRGIDKVLPPDSRWLYRIDAALRSVIGERMPVDHVLGALKRQTHGDGGDNSTAGILGDLGISDGALLPCKEWFSWPDLPALFNERADRSFWWAEPAPKLPPRQIIHCGPPDDDLFCLLMNGGGVAT
ncbi:MAG: type VI secretion system-associated protein TagF [Azoarcus sp.]|jgi:type VI secretion system protein ImpM|nr:type VI secretion system-associated protein TagF [Azoarcus sp.]